MSVTYSFEAATDRRKERTRQQSTQTREGDHYWQANDCSDRSYLIRAGRTSRPSCSWLPYLRTEYYGFMLLLVLLVGPQKGSTITAAFYPVVSSSSCSFNRAATTTPHTRNAPTTPRLWSAKEFSSADDNLYQSNHEINSSSNNSNGPNSSFTTQHQPSLYHNGYNNNDWQDDRHHEQAQATAALNSSTSSMADSATIIMRRLERRIAQLEHIVTEQDTALRQLQEDYRSLTDVTASFARIVELLRKAGIKMESVNTGDIGQDEGDEGNVETESFTGNGSTVNTDQLADPMVGYPVSIFGQAPSDVMEAADAAGAAILAGLLAGKQRMLVDVRDAELSLPPHDTLVEFVELALLPVAAGLEGLRSKRNRLKIVFPTVSQLLQFRKSMTLAAPDVVALSTLGFDPIEENDNLVVILAPAPDDSEGLEQMNDLLHSEPLQSQPVVVLNTHMSPLTGPAAKYDPVYHLRLLSVQYMTSLPFTATSDLAAPFPQDALPPSTGPLDGEERGLLDEGSASFPVGNMLPQQNASMPTAAAISTNTADLLSETDHDDKENDALEAAMRHAHEVGIQRGVTRAMVIRAYPRPWHVFLDTSPDTDADFQIAATFDQEPSPEEINLAIVECLEGSEQEDEIVAQQMQQALESGQLDRVSDLLGRLYQSDAYHDEEDGDGDLWDRLEEDSV